MSVAQAESSAVSVPQTTGSKSSSTSANEGCFAKKHIVFWTRSHTATLKQKATQAGAILEDKVTGSTQLVVAARDTSATDAAAHLADLPVSIPLRSKKWEGRKLKIPTNIDFVVPQYISDCLVQARILPTSAYLIALQQVATKDTRTYSNEECVVSTTEAPEVAQLHKSDEQQPAVDHALTTTGKDAVASISAAVSQQQQPDASFPGSTQKAAAPDQPVLHEQDDKRLGTEKRIGIYPDVNPAERSFTGGHTGIPWGTGRLLWTRLVETLLSSFARVFTCLECKVHALKRHQNVCCNELCVKPYSACAYSQAIYAPQSLSRHKTQCSTCFTVNNVVAAV